MRTDAKEKEKKAKVDAQMQKHLAAAGGAAAPQEEAKGEGGKK